MNEEMKCLFNKLPEGIILLEEKSGNISLANTESKRLMRVESLDQLNTCLNEKLFFQFDSQARNENPAM